MGTARYTKAIKIVDLISEKKKNKIEEKILELY